MPPSPPSVSAVPRVSDGLGRLEADYDAEVGMPRSTMRSPGYHTTLAEGTTVHETRRSLEYALQLLDDGRADRLARAHRVIDRVIELQQTDPCQPTYGIWPWFLEEPLERMSPPDWNWADFCGARLILALTRHGARIEGGTVARMREAIGHAAWSIFRRNVQPHYTNIAIMGGWVTAAAGELLGEDRLRDYGRRRLERFVEHTRRHGGFNEYNSPTYTLVALHETEACLEVVRCPSIRQMAEDIRRVAWETIADHFHPGTRQWAGPHSRAYHDLLGPKALADLAVRVGDPPGPADGSGRPDQAPVEGIVRPLPCPADLRERFVRLPEPEVFLHRRFEDRGGGERDRIGSTWMNDSACLGSINHDCMWTQRRPLLAYWGCDSGNPSDPGPRVAVLRLRFLKDGRDFASAGIACRQDRRRAEGEVTLTPGLGDYHVSLDHPVDGLFHGKDYRLRFELHGPGAGVERLSESGWRLSAGGRSALVGFGDDRGCVFEGGPVAFEQGSQSDAHGGRAWADAVCHAGSPRSVNPGSPSGPTRLPFRIELEASGR